MLNAHEIRRRNFIDLLVEFRSKGPENTDALFGDKHGIARGHVSQLKTGTRDMGNKVARRIEKALKLEPGWMDISHDPKDQYVTESDVKHYIDPQTLKVVFDEMLEVGIPIPKNTKTLTDFVAQHYTLLMIGARLDIQKSIKSALSQSLTREQFRELLTGRENVRQGENENSHE